MDESTLSSVLPNSERKTIIDFVNVDDLEKKLRNDISKRIASLNWGIHLEDQEKHLLKKAVTVDTEIMADQGICSASMQEMQSEVILKAIDFEEIKSTVVENMLKRKEIGASRCQK